MNPMIRKYLGILLVLAMILAMVPAVAPVEAQAATVSNAQKMQNGVTLHAWNWSFKNIEANMAKIASLGYTSIQVPPIQTAKQTTAGYSMSDWWVYYQPADFAIDNTGRSALGNKAQFESMCKEAHKYGISVIVDVVANHMADNGSNKLHSAVNADLRNDSSCWHDISKNISNYHDRYNITQYCLDGVPDLNTSNKKVQNYVLNYLKECVDAGADGFRFDAVKHIETPDDTYCSSDFWPTVINGIKKYDSDVYLYGELLYHPDDSNSISDKIYTKYFSVTDNSWSNSIRNNVICGGNAGAFSYSYHKDAEANQLVLWAESHDTYAGNDNSDDVSIQNINKTWALVAARADAMSLYLARPQNLYPQKLGEVTKGGWDAPEVAAVNKFHNAFAGQGEYVSNQNNIAYVERGNSGVVLVNCGGTSGNVSVTANAMANGTYKDQITGNTFTVANGKITGTIGSTGIAVVYNATACAHKSHTQAGLCSDCYAQVGHTYVSGICACGKVQPVDRVIYFTNSGNWSKVNIYAWNDAGTQAGEWPGTAMTKTADGKYTFTLSGEAENVIFNNGTDQTDDLDLPALSTGYNHYDFTSGKWSFYDDGTSCAHTSHGTDGKCTVCGVTVGHTFVGGTCACGATKPVEGLDYYLIGNINGEDHGDGDDYANLGDYSFKNGPITVAFTETSYVCVKNAANTTWYMTDGWQGEVTSVTLYDTAKLDTTADKLMIPGGVTVTISLEENADGTLTLSYSTDGTIPDLPDIPDIPDDPTQKTVYFDNTAGWDTVNIYYWSDANNAMIGWPGTAMTKVEGNIYSFTLPADAEYVIFNDGTTQTDDLTIPEDKNLYSYATGNWTDYAPPQPVTIYFQNTAGWSTPYIYAWSDAGEFVGTWPGLPMSPVAGQAGLYSFSLSSSATQVIFHNNEGLQTDDLTVPTDGKNLYTYNTDSWSVYQVCTHKAHDDQGICTGCGKNVGHNWVSGKCDGCGGQQVSITRQPVSVTVAAGAQAKVTFTAIGDGLTYKWYYKNKGASAFSLTKTFDGNTYTAEMNATRDGRRIYCVITDKYGNSVTTDTVTISMKTPLAITKQPVSVSVNAGAKATVTVGATGDGLTYKWYYANKGSNKFTVTTAFTGSSYSLSMTAARDGRRIYCVITDKHGNSVTTDTVTLSMKSSLVITAQPQNVTVVSGAQAKVTVSAQGEGLTYKWYYANKGSNKFLLTNTFKGNTYTAEMNATRDGRRIYCVITDKYGNSVTTNTVTLSMKSSLVITGQPQSITVAAGAQAKITVSVQGEGLTYKWYYANKGSNKFLLTNSFTGNTYSLSMTTARDGRRVYCVITDKYGSSVTTDTVTISMKSGVTITKQPVSVAVAAGAQAKVTVSAQGEGLTYQWFYADAGSDTFKKTTAFKGNSYNVSMTVARNGRRIYCVITDANGNSVTTEIVTISMK